MKEISVVNWTAKTEEKILFERQKFISGSPPRARPQK